MYFLMDVQKNLSKSCLKCLSIKMYLEYSTKYLRKYIEKNLLRNGNTSKVFRLQ